MSVGDRVRRAREDAGLSIRDAARQAEIPEETWSRIENGRTPRVPTISKMASVLSVAAAELMRGEEPSVPVRSSTHVHDAWLRIWRSLRTPEERADFLVAAEMADSRHPLDAMNREDSAARELQTA